MTEFNYTVTENDRELSVKELLRRNFNFSSRLMTKLKTQDLIKLNGESVRGWIKPNVNDKLTVTMPQETSDFEPENIPISVIFEDNDLLVINKQPGFVVHPTKGKPCHTMANGVMKKMLDEGQSYKIRFANRLDMNTSGLLVVAKNSFTQDKIICQMKAGITKKRYLAVIDGIIEADSGTINAPIGRPDNNEVERWILPVEDGGYDSITHYKVLERFSKEYTLVEVSLETGRTHQIRVHMASIGHAITGDHLYNNGDPFLYRKLHGDFRRIEGYQEKSTSKYIDRQALHAYYLSFIHPVTNTLLELEAPMPEDMKKLIESIK
jgi:23S rRNA pseudouridine1911/1915/1917 synthase